MPPLNRLSIRCAHPLCLALFLTLLFLPWAAEAKKIVLIAGSLDTHPKNSHEYEKNIVLLKHCLDTSPDLKGWTTEVYFNGWPGNASALADADTILLTSGGSDHREQDHPLYLGDHLAQLEKQMKRGCGIVFFHWSTFHPIRVHDQITEWVGGYFDYETGNTPNHWYSAIETREWTASPATPSHPINRGVIPFKLQEEFYFKIRFREADPRLVPIVVNDTLGEARANTVGWAVQRDDGGRGFGFTGGHFYDNWWIPEFRRLILNALVWTAGGEVPANGVSSTLEPRVKTLIVTGNDHPAHDWRTKSGVLIPLLEQDPRLSVEVTENPEELASLKSRGYGLVVLNYANYGGPGLSDAAKTGFTNYLAAGGGLSVIHFANGAFHFSLQNAAQSDWPLYRQIVRRVWDHTGNKSGHDSYAPFHVNLTGVAHSITRGLSDFDTTDELYHDQVGDLPIEPLVTARSKQTGREEPLAWAYEFTQARVFQTVLGHDAKSLQSAAALIRRGSVWAARLSPLGFDPPGVNFESIPFRNGSQWTPETSRKKSSASITPPAPTLITNTPRASKEPVQQVEKDWEDSRWQKTHIGRFLASTLPSPNGMIPKGLSVKVGDQDPATVAYDTAAPNLRIAWTGDFLKFPTARFSINGEPKPAGPIQWIAPASNAWHGASTHYDGLRLNGNRVVLQYHVGDTAIAETPWVESKETTVVFTRTLEIAAHAHSLTLDVLELKGAVDGDSVTRDQLNGRTLQRGNERAFVMAGEGGKVQGVSGADGKLSVTFDARDKTQSIQLIVWSGGLEQLDTALALTSRATTTPSVHVLAGPGPPHWTTLTTRGQKGFGSQPYLIDTLTVPYENPSQALFFTSGVDFLNNGDAVVCTLHGDVWQVSGIDDGLEKLTWHRFATGLFQPLGLRVYQNEVYVLGRDQITRLRDLNGDGEADEYHNFSNLIRTSIGGHDYVTSLETDAAGNFYYVDPLGVHRISSDGKHRDTLATGWRNPNGMSVGPDGTITVTPQQGNWTPSSQISEVKTGGYYGFGGPKVQPDRPLGYDLPLCWIPHGVDNSTGSQVWVTSDRWGPFKGQLLSLSFGRAAMSLVLREKVNGVPQGGVIPLKGKFLSGAMRGTFSPKDGQLYVVGSQGWQTAGIRDGCLQRVRYTGAKVYEPIALHALRDGLRVTFTQPLDPSTAADPSSYNVERWNYRYSGQYGSKDYSVKDPEKEGHDEMKVASVTLLEDGRSVFLKIPDLQPVMQMHLQYNLNATDGGLFRGDLYHTINALGAEGP